MWIAALAAGLSLNAPADLLKPGEEAAFMAQLGDVMRQVALVRAGGSCPADTQVDFGGAHRVGTAGSLFKAGPDDPVDPQTGVYKQQLRVRGCPDQARQENVLIIRQKAGGWIMTPFVPGDSMVGPQLFHDVLTTVVPLATAGGASPGETCPNGEKACYLADTLLLTPRPTNGSPLQTWRERWVQTACGADRSMVVTFTATSAGTTFEAKPDWSGSASP